MYSSLLQLSRCRHIQCNPIRYIHNIRCIAIRQPFVLHARVCAIHFAVPLCTGRLSSPIMFTVVLFSFTTLLFRCLFFPCECHHSAFSLYRSYYCACSIHIDTPSFLRLRSTAVASQQQYRGIQSNRIRTYSVLDARARTQCEWGSNPIRFRVVTARSPVLMLRLCLLFCCCSCKNIINFLLLVSLFLVPTGLEKYTACLSNPTRFDCLLPAWANL